MKLFKALTALGAASLVVACAEGTSPSSVRFPSDPSLVLVNPPTASARAAAPERLRVCKDFVMQSGAPAPTANFSLVAANSGNMNFTLNNGECKEVLITSGEDATVTETGFTGVLTFTSKVAITGSAGFSNTIDPYTVGSGVLTHPAPAEGFLLVFTNTEEFNTGGCTLTQGYWKTHSSYGPAGPSDPIWNTVGGPDAVFFFSGLTWIQLFNTPPQGGNAYIQLAHQYMAAVLNVNNGATPAPPELALATAFFNNAANTPSTAYSKSTIQTLRTWAGALASFNEGTTGPGHC